MVVEVGVVGVARGWWRGGSTCSTSGVVVSFAAPAATSRLSSSPRLPQILHRDLKAENVLLTRGADGRLCAKLADFGLHKLVGRSSKAQWSFNDIK